MTFFIGLILAIIAGGSTLFHYTVESHSNPAISHVTFELCPAANVLEAGVYSNGQYIPTEYELGTDPTTGIYGVKFDEPFADNETREYYLKLEGDWPTARMRVAVEGGTQVLIKRIPGPSLEDPKCEPTAIDLTFFGIRSGLSVVFLVVAALLVVVTLLALLYQRRPIYN